MTYDAIVLGLGGMGSAACYHLAQKGMRVLGLEQYSFAHDRGSSHGETRLIRQAYFEHLDYVPLLLRSYELWEQLQKEGGRTLLHRTGLVLYGPEEGGAILPGVEKTALHHSLPIQSLTAKEARDLYPYFDPPAGFRAILEPAGGYLEVENCVREHLSLASRLGATLLEGQRILRWTSLSGEVEVETYQHKYRAKSLIIAAGAWSEEILAELSLSLSIHRNHLFWFQASDSYDVSRGVPCFGFELAEGFFYGFPRLGESGLKLAHHLPGQSVEPLSLFESNGISRPRLEDLDPVIRCAKQTLPGVDPFPIRSVSCLYEMSRDSHFIIDTHPQFENVAFAAGFSGHGFKFSTVVGEILADLVVTGKTRHPIDFLSLKRFGVE